ncbi:hypothetical protein BpHYR1_022840 [Brachionus plicatilis]|uniref:Uncharacterized protein n=1 Tax=Brachionus plicatilis TaxID=10195 RepID=A0A3M7QWH8_BRAPC|nr:hypothetical protein BpHYR1_022840 [Brachionus plicatilis]
MAGQILEDREVAGQPCADWPANRVQTGRPQNVIKSSIYYLSNSWISKILFWTVLWPVGLHTVSRLTVFQLTGHFTVGLSGGRPWKDRHF